MAPAQRKRGPPASLRIDTPTHNSQVTIAVGDSSASALSSATSESDYSPFPTSSKARLTRNMKKLSLNLPSAQSSSNSLPLHLEPQTAAVGTFPAEISKPERPRRPSIISLPSTVNPTASLLHRREEEGSPAVPYADGPIQILPGIWLGSEDNARDWKGLMERGIKSLLNVAKEVSSPFDSASISQPLRSVVSTPNFKSSMPIDPTYHPPNLALGRPGMHYLKLQWSHGQQDLVNVGFQAGMAFTDAALERGEGVLIHCQCGISRSATMVIALVMRAAAQRSPNVPPEVWALKGMQGAYAFVKEKSKWIGPNMSLIYQLLEYEKKFKGSNNSLFSTENSMSLSEEEEEWGRRRRLLDETPSDAEEDERESSIVQKEAEALDKAMQDRVVARKSSTSSVGSSNSGMGMGAAWRSRYGSTRKRAESIGSSIISEDLVEEEEEEELLGVGGGFDEEKLERSSSAEPEDSSNANSPDDDVDRPSGPVNMFTQRTARLAMRPPPSAPVSKTSFNLPRPSSIAVRSTFDVPARPVRPSLQGKKRPPPIGILPPVPSSPISIIVDSSEPTSKATSPLVPTKLSLPPVRTRKQSQNLIPPPLHLRAKKSAIPKDQPTFASTPSQTLFVFPPSPTLTTRTPSAITITSNIGTSIPFPSLATPRVSTFRSQGRTRSFIGLGIPPTPTTAFSKVDARGYVALD